MHGWVSSLGAFVLVSVMLLFHLFSPLGCMKWTESENQWWPAALLHCPHIWEVNGTETQRTVNELYPIQHENEWTETVTREKLKFCSMLLYLSRYETILAFSRISRRFCCSAVSGFNVWLNLSFNEFRSRTTPLPSALTSDWMDYEFHFIRIMRSQKVRSGLSGGYRMNYTAALIKYNGVERLTLNTHSAVSLTLALSLCLPHCLPWDHLNP